MEEPDPLDVERARTLWAERDVDQVFGVVFGYLEHLRNVLKADTATDKERVQGLKLLDCLDWLVLTPPTTPQVVKVVVGSDPESYPCRPTQPPPSATSASGGNEQPHVCSKSCLPLPTTLPQSTPIFWGQNPLRVPLFWGFKRRSHVVQTKWAVPTGGSSRGGVVYSTPCGRILRNEDDVMDFLSATECHGLLQMDFFSFNPAVQAERPAVGVGPRRPELDLSRGVEPTPVELCAEPGDALPADFRYRKERWPHGCFLSAASGVLFRTCCDCTDGCSNARSCACAAMTRGGRRYTFQRLTQPVASGVYECGPWCGCPRPLCQNRLVQRGLRVRLQVFRTERRGWGVRCRDDLDAGTFVCIFAGVLLQRVPNLSEPPPPKLTRVDLPSDDDVEVVTEWLAPPVLEGRGNMLETPPSTLLPPPLHVPVIQRSSDGATAAAGSPSAGEQKVTLSVNGDGRKRSSRRATTPDDVYLVDARREGNVSRFFNHSCRPNLFIQNVFTDSHDPQFPVAAFFTSRVVTAGTELTWDYSADNPGVALPEQEVPCLCGSDGCRGRFTVTEDVCEVEY